MTYVVDQKCQTEGCEGRPFFGETLSPGYCDDCHARRFTPRPSRALYLREPGTGWERVVEETDSVYEFGYEMGQRDAKAELDPMPAEEFAALCHGDYREGYLDAYSDFGPRV